MGMVTAPVTREPTSLQQMGGSSLICRNIWGKDFSSMYKIMIIMVAHLKRPLIPIKSDLLYMCFKFLSDLRLVPGKIGFLTWGRRGRRRVNPEEVILEESPQVPSLPSLKQYILFFGLCERVSVSAIGGRECRRGV